MKHFYDFIANSQISFREEIGKIYQLLCKETKYYGAYFDVSLISYIDSNFFRSLPLKSNHITAESFLGVNGWFSNECDPRDMFCIVVEGVASLLYQTVYKHERELSDLAVEQIRSINTLIDEDVYRLGMKFQMVKTERYGPFQRVVFSSDEAMAAIQFVPDQKTAELILSYVRVLSSNDVDYKKRILGDLYFGLKPLFDAQRSGMPFSGLLGDIRSFVNNLDIRHPNKNATGKEESKFLHAMGRAELVKAYDALYAMILSAVVQIGALEYEKTISDIKSKIANEKH